MKSIPTHPGYFADEAGNIFYQNRLDVPPRKLKPQIKEGGYHYVKMHHDNTVVKPLVHRLVLETFVGPCPAGMEGCHFPDKDVSNNRLDNLRWCTRKTNKEHRKVHDTWGTRLNELQVRIAIRCCTNMIHEFRMTQKEVGQLFGVPQRTIGNIFDGNSWKHLGYERVSKKGHNRSRRSINGIEQQHVYQPTYPIITEPSFSSTVCQLSGC